jgi:hypothetical protein
MSAFEVDGHDAQAIASAIDHHFRKVLVQSQYPVEIRIEDLGS